MMSREENVAIFENTRAICKSNPIIANAIKLSNDHQEVFLEGAPVWPAPKANAEPAKVIVTKRRSFEAAWHYAGYETCVLNFASATNPGGGVAWGSTAQEECLCRCSTLYANLIVRSNWDQFYEPHRKQNNPLYNDDCIYTPDVLVFKSDIRTPQLLDPEDWIQCNVITCAAPNLRTDRDGTVRVRISNAELKELHIKRMRRILSIAASRGNDVVILGAYGCGAFKNPPEVVAQAMKHVVEEYKNYFVTIEFAVYCSPRDEQNYLTFKRILGAYEK